METMELTLRCDNPDCTYCNRPWRDMPDDSEDMVKWADVWPEPDNAMRTTLMTADDWVAINTYGMTHPAGDAPVEAR